MRTPAEMQKYLTNDQLKLYTLIWNRVVASQMTDAVYDVTTLTIDAADYQLRATGSVLKFPGFLQLHSKYDDKEKDSKVPYVEPGSKLLLYKLLIILIRCYINIFKLYEWADTLNCQLNHGLSVVRQG